MVLAGKGCMPLALEQEGSASLLRPSHPLFPATSCSSWQRSSSGGKPCPEHPTLLRAPADVSALGPGSEGSWKCPSPTAQHPGTPFPQLTWSLALEVTVQPQPLLWGPEAWQSRQSPRDARARD